MKKKETPPPITVDEYLARTPEPARAKLKKIRAIVRSLAPHGTTECISYMIPAFKYKGMLVWYAAFKNHYSLFPGAAVITKYRKDLAAYPVWKGTVRFPLNKPVPTALIKKLVNAKIAENEKKAD